MKINKRLFLFLGMSLGMAMLGFDVAHADQQSKSTRILQKVAAAMGGKERILSIDTQQMIVSGERWEPQQTFAPGDEPLSVGTDAVQSHGRTHQTLRFKLPAGIDETGA
jgi:hypothetical protein